MTTEPNYIRDFQSKNARVVGDDNGNVLVIGTRQGLYDSGKMSREELVELRDWINELLEETK